MAVEAPKQLDSSHTLACRRPPGELFKNTDSWALGADSEGLQSNKVLADDRTGPLTCCLAWRGTQLGSGLIKC